MKRSVALLIAVVFGIGLAGSAVAQTTTPVPATPAPATTPAQKPAEAKPKSEVKKAKNAMGTVKSASADSLVARRFVLAHRTVRARRPLRRRRAQGHSCLAQQP